MIPVEQRWDYDCVTACLASIFEVSYEDAPQLWDRATDRPVEQWMAAFTRWLHERGFHPQQMSYNGHNGPRPLDSPWSWPTYWVGGVYSPRFKEPDGSDGAHAVVMHNSDLVWDPSPKRDMGHLGFYSAEFFLPRDPARLVLTEAVS